MKFYFSIESNNLNSSNVICKTKCQKNKKPMIDQKRNDKCKKQYCKMTKKIENFNSIPRNDLKFDQIPNCNNEIYYQNRYENECNKTVFNYYMGYCEQDNNQLEFNSFNQFENEYENITGISFHQKRLL